VTLLEVSNLTTRFFTGRGTIEAVSGVDMEIESGQTVGLVGESGSGKSVLAKSLMQIVEDTGEITDGSIRLDGDALLSKSDAEMQAIRGNRIGIVFQDPTNSLNPTLSVGEQIAEMVRLHQDTGESLGLPAEIKRKILGTAKNSEAWRRAIEMLESVEIPNADSRATDYPHMFSGGMRQRAMIAMALAGRPDLLIADEPTTALDVTTQARIFEELQALKQEFDTSILLITHDLSIVAENCDVVNVMYAGEIVERAGVDELFDNPQHPYTQALMRSIPRLDGPEEAIETIEGTVPELVDMPDACHFAPRCPEAKQECFERKPDFRSVGEEGHEAFCLRRGPEERRI
jgi:oligopeptide/dipeptide ABC transporter ATP-binding protein